MDVANHVRLLSERNRGVFGALVKLIFEMIDGIIRRYYKVCFCRRSAYPIPLLAKITVNYHRSPDDSRTDRQYSWTFSFVMQGYLKCYCVLFLLLALLYSRLAEIGYALNKRIKCLLKRIRRAIHLLEAETSRHGNDKMNYLPPISAIPPIAFPAEVHFIRTVIFYHLSLNVLHARKWETVREKAEACIIWYRTRIYYEFSFPAAKRRDILGHKI